MEKEPETMYEWEQVTDEANGLFLDTDLYPLAAALTIRRMRKLWRFLWIGR